MSDELEALREQVNQLRESRAAHAEKINAVATRVDSIATDVKTILGYIERSKGSWKMLLGIGTLMAGLVEGLHQLYGLFHRG